MMFRALAAAAFSVAAGLTGCATVDKAVPARLVAEPDAQQITAIRRSVKAAMGRSDLFMEPARLMYDSQLTVRPVAVEGVTDRVPGTPTRLTLMMDRTGCWLTDPDGMRIDLPEMACRRAER